MLIPTIALLHFMCYNKKYKISNHIKQGVKLNEGFGMQTDRIHGGGEKEIYYSRLSTQLRLENGELQTAL